MPQIEAFHTLRDYWRFAVSSFQRAQLHHGHGAGNAVDEAAWLLLWGLQLPHDSLESFLDARLMPDEGARLVQLIEQRIQTRQPTAYLTGEAWLQGVRFRCDARALVPRSFIAELLADASDALAPWLPQPPVRIADMGTGGGSLSILAALTWPQAHVDAFDLSSEALELARLNVADHGLTERVQLIQANLFEGVRERFDLVLCNPPYVTEDAMRALPPEYRHEPRLALAAGTDGMDVIARLLPQLKQRLQPQGVAVIEVGHNRAQFEARFPTLPVTWLSTSGGDDMVCLLERAALG